MKQQWRKWQTTNKVKSKTLHKELPLFTLSLLLCVWLLEARPGNPARLAPSSPRCSCSCFCRMPDAKGNKNTSTNTAESRFWIGNWSSKTKKVSMHISGYHERELLIALVLRWRLWGLGLLPVTKQWSAQWGEAPGRSIACWRGAYADSRLSSREGSIGPIWHLEVDQILIWIQVPARFRSKFRKCALIVGAMSEMKPASSWKGHCTW